jgi:D-alanyl-D-alanine dipeptidase
VVTTTVGSSNGVRFTVYCAFTGVAPYAPDPYGVDTANLTAATQQGLSCLQTSVQENGGSLFVTSAYRPDTYQAHLREVWDRHQQIDQIVGAACASVRTSIQDEWNRHGLTYQPAIISNHSSGTAFDASWSFSAPLPQGVTIDTLAQACGLSRCVPGDTVHFCGQ